MKKVLVYSAVALAVTGCSSTSDESRSEFAQTTAPVLLDHEPVERNPAWKLIWSDEFDGDTISKRNWQFEENCWGGGNNEQQCYTDSPSNAFVKDSMLHIVAKRENHTGPATADGKTSETRTLPYTSARLRTLGKRDWKYGRFEIRAKLPKGQGTWPAIWMLPSESKYGTWAASGEIDIMEAVNLGTPSDAQGYQSQPETRIYGTLHYGKNWPDNVHSGQGAVLPDGVSPADSFHTYAIEWEEGEIRWYVDNIHYATQTQDGWYSQYKQDGQLVNAPASAPFDEKFHLLLNLAVGGSWSANANNKGIDEDIFPQTMLVDYVKVYRCSADRWKGKGCATVSPDARLVKGHTAPKILTQDDSYSHGSEILVFGDTLNESLAYGSYDPANIVEHKIAEERGRGQVLHVTKSNGAGNLYFRSPKTDFSSWEESGELVFDIRLDEIAKGDLLVKIDSGWPKTSDYTVPLAANTEWQQIRIPVSDIVTGGNRFVAGNKVDLKAVSNLLVIEPMSAMSFSLDNIRFER